MSGVPQNGDARDHRHQERDRNERLQQTKADFTTSIIWCRIELFVRVTGPASGHLHTCARPSLSDDFHRDTKLDVVPAPQS